ncbi:MAG: low molecular weight protein-tyrosine-phosphatase [Pirellulaceae bacterium]
MPERRPELSVLFVCAGNICRSPAAEGIFWDLVQASGLSERIFVDSAGTHGYHTGEMADRRMIDAAKRRHLILKSRARKVLRNDLEDFEFVIAMDEENLQHLNALHGAPKAPARLISSFDKNNQWPVSVPDPYYGHSDGFEYVLDMLAALCPILLDEVVGRLHGKSNDS